MLTKFLRVLPLAILLLSACTRDYEEPTAEEPSEEPAIVDVPAVVPEETEDAFEPAEGWVIVTDDQYEKLTESVETGEAVGEVEITEVTEPTFSKVESQVFRLVGDESPFADTEVKITCELKCSGSLCSQIGCSPSSLFESCTSFSCGVSCTGTCTQTVTMGDDSAALFDSLE